MKILFYCDATEYSGIGHLIRCNNIAEYINNNTNAETAISGNIDINFIEEKGYGYIEIINGFSFLDYDLIVFDSYNEDEYKKINSQNIKKIAIDDMEIFDYPNWELVINFRLKENYKHYKAKKVLTGLKYFPASKFFKDLRNNFEKKEQIRNLFFYFGETKEIEIDTKVVEFINIYKKSYNFFIKTALDNSNWTQINNKNYHDLFAKSDVIIHGGGFTKYESAYSRKFNLSFSLTDLQKFDTEQLTKYNLVEDMGMFISFEDVLKNTVDFLENKNLNEKVLSFQDSSNKCFEKDSLSRISKEIIKVIN